MATTETASIGCFFKSVDEKHLSQEVKQMLWNPRMDLIALAFTNGDVHLYRMSWQKVWTLTNPQQNITITSMAWRPDGKVLAISYSNGHLRLLSVEDAKKIFSFNFTDSIQCLYWLQESDEMTSKQESSNFYEDISSRQLPKPISYDIISQLFEKANNRDFADNLFIKENKQMTFLVCAHGTSIAIFVYGYYLLIDANLDLVPSFLNYKQLKACFLSDNTSLISTLGLTEENLLVYSLLDARILEENNIQIKLLSTKFGMLYSMLTSLKDCIKEMDELWEDILVEMDQKFQSYALQRINSNKNMTTNNGVNNNNNNNPANGETASLVHDFMMLYAFGSCSEQFKAFLVNELTEKGLKKLEISVENYYSNIQRLLNGNFHHVIDQNLKEIKLFFKWLHSSILHLGEEQAVTDMIRFNEEMENSILDFIQNTFKDAQAINLEKVGQYLKSDNLRFHIHDDNSWYTFLKNKLTSKGNKRLENECLFMNKKEKSLIGCFEDFKHSLNDCFKSQALSSKQPFIFIKQYNIHKFNSLKDANEMLMSYKCLPNAMVTGLLMAKSNNECYILKHSINSDPDVKAFIINLSSHSIDMSQITLQDVYIYNESGVTLLGVDSKTLTSTYLIQLNLQLASQRVLNELLENEANGKSKDNNLLMIKAEKLNATSIVKYIKKFKCSLFCVSSSRKVAALLSSTKHQVKIYELECEDEDDEEIEEGDQASGDANEIEDIAGKQKVVILNDTLDNSTARVKRKKNLEDEDDDELSGKTNSEHFTSDNRSNNFIEDNIESKNN